MCAAVAVDPRAFELLYWGKRLVGVRVTLDAAALDAAALDAAALDAVKELLEEAQLRCASKH